MKVDLLLVRKISKRHFLTLFQARQGQFDPQHHTYVCSFYSNRARLTKIGDFVSLTIWLVPKKPFLKFLLQNFWKIWILNFWGSSSISRKLKILTKKIIFLQRFSFFHAESILYMLSAFFWGIQFFCSSKLKFWCFLAWKISILTIVMQVRVASKIYFIWE